MLKQTNKRQFTLAGNRYKPKPSIYLKKGNTRIRRLKQTNKRQFTLAGNRYKPKPSIYLKKGNTRKRSKRSIPWRRHNEVSLKLSSRTTKASNEELLKSKVREVRKAMDNKLYWIELIKHYGVNNLLRLFEVNNILGEVNIKNSNHVLVFQGLINLQQGLTIHDNILEYIIKKIFNIDFIKLIKNYLKKHIAQILSIVESNINKIIYQIKYIFMRIDDPNSKEEEDYYEIEDRYWLNENIDTKKDNPRYSRSKTKYFRYNSNGATMNRYLKGTNLRTKKRGMKWNTQRNLRGGGNTYVEKPGGMLVLSKSPCNDSYKRGECSDKSYLKILAKYGNYNGNDTKIRNKLLMRLVNTASKEDNMSKLMPFIEIILDGIHDFKKYFTKEDFKKYCDSINVFAESTCSKWLNDMYDVFDEDNLFVPFVKTNSTEFLTFGKIFVYDEKLAKLNLNHKTQLIKLYKERNIWGGLIYDAGRGLSHVRSLENKDTASVCYSGNDDSLVDPNLSTVLNTIAGLIDPAGFLSIKNTQFTELGDMNEIYEGYFAFLEEFQIFIRLYECKDNCNKVRFAIRVFNERPLKDQYPTIVKEINDIIKKNETNLLFKSAEKGIFFCNTKDKSSFTINNIKQNLKLLTTLESMLQIFNYNEAFKKNVADPVLFVLFYYLIKNTRLENKQIIFKSLPRLGYTFKLIGDRGQAWVVWKNNKENPSKKIMLVTGDRMLMIFAISIGIPAVWSAQGKEYGLNYYFFPTNENFNFNLVKINSETSRIPIKNNLDAYSKYSEISLESETLDSIYLNSLGKQLTGTETKVFKIAGPPGNFICEIIYDSCWKFISSSINTQLLNEDFASGGKNKYDYLFKFLGEGFGNISTQYFHLSMDPSAGRSVNYFKKGGLQQKTYGTKYKNTSVPYNTEQKRISVKSFWDRFTVKGTGFGCDNIEEIVNTFIQKFKINPHQGRAISKILNPLFHESGITLDDQNINLNTMKLKSYILLGIKEHIFKKINEQLSTNINNIVSKNPILIEKHVPTPTEPYNVVIRSLPNTINVNLTKKDNTPLTVLEYKVALSIIKNDDINSLTSRIKKAVILNPNAIINEETGGPSPNNDDEDL